MRKKLTLSVATIVLMAAAGCSTRTAGLPAMPPTGPEQPTSPVTTANFRPLPQFVGDPVSPAPTPRYVSTMNLYGEMPGSPRVAGSDTLDNLQQITFTREGADFDVDVDPTGRWLVYASTRHRPTSDLYLKRLNGNAVTLLTNDPANDTMPAISPDGNLVAFCSDRAGSWDLYIKPITGGKAMQLTSGPSQDLHPSWSPDGTKIVYCSLNPQSGQWEMVVVDVANPVGRHYIGDGLFPEFSPRGDKIAFQRARFRGTRWFSVWTVNYENGQASQPTEIAVSTNAAVITPTWSPDGSRLAFVTVVNPGNDPTVRPESSDLWLCNADGNGRINLTNDRYVNLQPAWGPNNQLYFISNRGAADNIWSVDTTRTLLVSHPVKKEPEQTQAMVPTE